MAMDSSEASQSIELAESDGIYFSPSSENVKPSTDDPRDNFGYIHARNATNWLDDNRKLSYKMRSSPRGYALIINNFKFNDDRLNRTGANYDSEVLKRLWSQLGYDVTLKENLNHECFLEEVKKFGSMEEHRKVDSTVVFVCTHGSQNLNSLHEVMLKTTDGKAVGSDWIVAQIATKSLAGKPKMFFFQACRGTAKQTLSSPANATTDGNVNGCDDIIEADIIAVFPSSPGFVALRSHKTGTWLVQTLSDVFMMEACQEDLETMLHEVSRVLRERFSRIGTQVLNFENRGFSRKLYFNPGLVTRKSRIKPPDVF